MGLALRATLLGGLHAYLMVPGGACRACLSSLASVALCMVQLLPDFNCATAPQTYLWVDVWSFRRGAVPACDADVP